MPQNKRQIKLTIILLLTLILISQFFLISLAKTEVYFSLYDNPQKAIIKNINQAEAFINIAMYVFTDKEIATSLINAQDKGVKISKPLAQKIIVLREELVEFKNPKDLLQLLELTTLEWQEWKEHGIIITIE